jgi:hypothetical protein
VFEEIYKEGASAPPARGEAAPTADDEQWTLSGDEQWSDDEQCLVRVSRGLRVKVPGSMSLVRRKTLRLS